MSQWCGACKILPKCPTVTEHMLDNAESCLLWEEDSIGVILGRSDFALDFGVATLLPNPNPPKREQTMPKVSTSVLRKLAIKAKIIDRSPDAFGFDYSDIIAKLKPRWSDIEDLDEEEVRALIDDLDGDEESAPPTKKTTARKKTTTTRRRKAPHKEKESEEEEESEEEPAPTKKPARRRAATRRRKTSAKKEEASESEEKTAGAGVSVEVDLKPVIDGIDTLGSLATGTRTDLGNLASVVDELSTKVNTIMSHLTWRYNAEFVDEDEGDEPIETLGEIDWMA